MGLDSPVILIILLFFLIFIFLLAIFLVRWVLRINKFLAFQKAQTALLIEIAKKQQIDNIRLGEIIGELNRS